MSEEHGARDAAAPPTRGGVDGIPSHSAERLFTDHWTDLVRCAAFALGVRDDADAEDLAADAVMSLLNGRFDRRNIPPEKVFAYARAVIRNRAMHEHRHARRFIADDRLLSDLSAGTDSFAMLDKLFDLERAMSAVAAAQRRVLEQHYLEGMTIAEIAAAARVSEGAIRVRLHRARSALRQALHETGG